MDTKIIMSLASTVALSAVAFAAVAKSSSETAAVGQDAPKFTLTDQNGKEVALPADKVVVLEWFNEGCPFVQKHYKNGDMNKLAEKYKEKGVVWLAVNSGNGATADKNLATAKKWNMDRPILDDSKGEVGRSYDATNTPHMYVINKGKLVYKGAIDSDSSADASAVAGATNYVAAALDAVLADKAVERSETKAYGCTVKYGK